MDACLPVRAWRARRASLDRLTKHRPRATRINRFGEITPTKTAFETHIVDRSSHPAVRERQEFQLLTDS
jgi:hypothetical protein